MLRFFPFGKTFEAGMGGRTLRQDEALFDIDLPHYAAEVALKRELLGASPHEYFSGGAELLDAQWDVLDLVLTDLSEHYPERFRLERFGHRWHWHNLLLGEEQAFVRGDAASLPLEPLDWAGRQVQEDLVLVSADARHRLCRGAALFSERLGYRRPNRALVYDDSRTYPRHDHAVGSRGYPAAERYETGQNALANELELQADRPTRPIDQT